MSSQYDDSSSNPDTVWAVVVGFDLYRVLVMTDKVDVVVADEYVDFVLFGRVWMVYEHSPLLHHRHFQARRQICFD